MVSEVWSPDLNAALRLLPYTINQHGLLVIFRFVKYQAPALVI